MKAGRRVVVVGGMNIDIQGKSFLPFKSHDSNAGILEIFPGGVGRNIAENLARLGLEVQLVSVLGDDVSSRALEESCQAAGIGLEGLVRLVGKPAAHYLCLLDADGGLAGAVASMGAIDSLLPDRLEAKASLLDSAELIILDANIPESSIAWLASRYPKDGSGPRLCFDPVCAQKAARGRAFLGAFAFAKPNREEASVLAGFANKECAETSEIASALRAMGLGEAFVTLGYEGIWAEGPGRERWIARIPARRPAGLESVNSSGAGDARPAPPSPGG